MIAHLKHQDGRMVKEVVWEEVISFSKTKLMSSSSNCSKTRLYLWGFPVTKVTSDEYSVSSSTFHVLTQPIVDGCYSPPNSGFNFWFVNLPDLVYISKIASSASSVALLSRCGRVFSWGRFSGHRENPLTPTPIQVLQTHGITDVAAGETHFIFRSIRTSIHLGQGRPRSWSWR
jgi:hypothetical protein